MANRTSLYETDRTKAGLPKSDDLSLKPLNGDFRISYQTPTSIKSQAEAKQVPAPDPAPQPSQEAAAAENGPANGLYYKDITEQTYMDEIQKAASEKNYKALLQSDIAAYNLKMNTQKYLQNELAAQGLGSQGYGTSAHVGVENQAANLYAQNLERYNDAEATALSEAQERKSTADLEADKELYQFLTNYNGTQESINGYMDKYGYAQGNDGMWYHKDAAGNADMSRPASGFVQATVQYATENSSDSNENYSNIDTSTDAGKAAYDFINSNASSYKGVNASGYDTVDGLSRALVGAQDNSVQKELNEVVTDELDYVRKHINDFADGTLLKLQRGSGHNEAYLIMYAGGKFYLVSSDDREESGYPVSEAYNSYGGPKVTIKGGKKE